MKDLLLCVHVVAKTLTLEISRCHLADYVKELYLSACRMCSTIICHHSTNQIIVFWRRRCRCHPPCLSFLIGYFGKYHNTLCLSLQILHKHCFQFLWGFTMVPRENKNNAYVKFWGHKQRVLWYFPKFPIEPH